MEIDLAVLADYAAVTQEGKLIIGGIFERVMARQMPWQHPSMALVFRLRVHAGEAREHDVSVTCVDPDGKEILAPMRQRMAAPPASEFEETAANFVFGINGVRFETAGRYQFDIHLDGKNVRSVPFEVITPPPAADDAADAGAADGAEDETAADEAPDGEPE